jgi:class 3 adenylate cyclase
LHFSSGLAVDGAWRSGQLWHGGLARRLAAIFLVIGVLPALLLGMDLTLLAPIRSVQGLSVDNVIALDLIASLYVVFASVYFVSRSLLAPARELFEAHEAVRGGNLQYTAAVLTNDELGEVTARFNTMVAALRERAMMKDALQRYLSPGVATELIASGGMIPSRLVEATVMFTDIEAFTTLSETLTPQETVDTLNAYFSVLTAVIHREGGTVNNFVGDAVVAVFNVPLPQADHAHAAVRAALAIQRQLAVQRFSLADGRHVALPTRIGVHTGPVCAGSIGGSDRQGYTVYGDAVNLAARIEQLNKRFQTRILVSDATRALVVAQGCAEHFSPLPRTTVMGRQEPVEVFSLGPAA